MTTSADQSGAYGSQMAKYFTMNQPPHIALDSVVSVARPQMAITRLIAKSGIAERTASIPSERAYVVSFHLSPASRGEWELWTAGKHIKTGAWPVGGVAMCDLESDTSIRNPGPIDWVHYHVPRATLDGITEDEGIQKVDTLHCVYGTPDATISHMTQLILPYLDTPKMFSPLFIDSFSLMLCSHLVNQYTGTRAAGERRRGGLAPWQRRRVTELLHVHLDGEIKLATLAEECRLSVSHFSRAFKTSFGTSAHRYLILQRVEVAKALLSQTHTPLSEVASRAGFSDQATLTRTFRSVVGAPPGQWRRESATRPRPRVERTGTKEAARNRRG
jgi:AraC family transcriptional regulator